MFTSSFAFTAFPLQYLIQRIVLQETQRDLATFQNCTQLCTHWTCVCYPHKHTIVTVPTARLKMIAKNENSYSESNLAHSLCSQSHHVLNKAHIFIFALDCGRRSWISQEGFIRMKALGISCTVVVLTCFVMRGCVCVGFVMCGCVYVWVGFVIYGCGLCSMWVWVCVGFVMCGCVYVWVL
jgi:hypothetical protein